MADSQLTMSFVTYKDVPGHPGYRIGDDGTYWSCKDHVHGGFGPPLEWTQRKPSPDKLGYLYGSFYTDKKSYRIALHRLVLICFVGPCPTGMVCCHNNGISNDNRLENLRWDTQKANIHDQMKHAKLYNRKCVNAPGEGNPKSKLRLADIAEIISLKAQGKTTLALSVQFGVCQEQIRRIARRAAWRCAD